MALLIVMTIVSCLCYGSFVHSSAIPMWEMLSRNEKLAYLYSHFLNQVEEYCEFSQLNNCDKELLKYGLEKLHSMSDEHLDRMDPYQRGAQNIIWDSMMDGHDMMKVKTTTTTTPISITSTAMPPQRPYYREKVTGYNYLSSRPTAIYPKKRISSIQDQILAEENLNKAYNNPQPTPMRQENPNDYYIMDDLYTDNNQLNTAASSRLEQIIPVSNEFPVGPMMGPMVIRVRPDGTLVDKKMPADEDLIHYKMSKAKVPSKLMLDKFIDQFRPVHHHNQYPVPAHFVPTRTTYISTRA